MGLAAKTLFPHERDGTDDSGKSTAAVRISECPVCIFGKYGIGKSTWAAKWPSPLFLATEAGTNLMDPRPASVPLTSWSDLTNPERGGILDRLEDEAGQIPYKTLVIDTVDLLYTFCMRVVCDRIGYIHPSEKDDYGFAWGIVGAEWRLALNRLTSLDMAVVLISHEKEEDEKEKLGTKMVNTGRKTICASLSGSARNILHSHVDFVLRAGMNEKGERVMWTQPTETTTHRIDAKGRGNEGRQLPVTIPLDFMAYAKAFDVAFNSEKE